MAIIKTTEDGWDCVPELKDVMNEIDNVNSIIYEIKNCVRQHDLYDIVEELKNMAYTINDILENIDEDQEFETVDEEEL